MRYSLINRQPNWTFNSARDFDSLVERFFMDDFYPGKSTAITEPKAEVTETEAGYLLSLDVPGLREEDIKIELNEGVLKVSGERKSTNEVNEKNFHRTEKYYGSFERNFTLPKNAATDKVEAHAENGVLQIAIPKSADSTGKTIEVKKGTSNFFEKWIKQ